MKYPIWQVTRQTSSRHASGGIPGQDHNGMDNNQLLSQIHPDRHAGQPADHLAEIPQIHIVLFFPALRCYDADP